MDTTLSHAHSLIAPDLLPPIDFPVIESGVPVDDTGPDLEDHVASYGGGALVDQLRAAQHAGCVTTANFQQRPEAFFRGQADRGAHFSVVFSTHRQVPLAIAEPRARWRLWCAVSHYQSDRWRRHRARARPVAVVSLHSPGEAISQLDFAVKRLGYEIINLVLPDADVRAAVGPAFDPLWAAIVERATPALIDCRGPAGSGRAQRALAATLAREEVLRRHPGLRIGLVGSRLERFGGAFTWLHPLPDSWLRAGQGDLDDEAFRMRLFATPYAFYTNPRGSFFAGTAIEEKLGVARALRRVAITQSGPGPDAEPPAINEALPEATPAI